MSALLVLASAFRAISGEYTSVELNAMSNTEMLNLLHAHILRAAENDAISLQAELARRLDET